MKTTKGLTGLFWKRAREFPPCIVRMLARRSNGPWLTDTEIVAKSGLTAYMVATISLETSWDNVKMTDMRQFLTGCGVDFTDSKCMNRIRMYLKTKNRFAYLLDNPHFKATLGPLIKKFNSSISP